MQTVTTRYVTEAWQAVYAGADVEVEVSASIEVFMAYGESAPAGTVRGRQIKAEVPLVATVPSGTSVYFRAPELGPSGEYAVSVTEADA